MVIYLNEKTSSLNFYNDFMTEMAAYFKQPESKKTPPAISFENLKWLDARVIPNLICVGLILKDYYKSSIELKLVYTPTLLYFLYNAGFFRLVGKSGYDIYQYNEEFVGGFGDFVNKEYRDKHIITQFYPINNFYHLSPDEQLYTKRAVFNKLSEFDVPHVFNHILNDIGALDENSLKLTLDCLSELICNSILYSRSMAFSYLQTNKFGTYISISDIGISFEKSLKLKEIQGSLQEEFSLKNTSFNGIDLGSETLKDFFVLFDALKYSKDQERINLWTLKNIVVENNGIFRIHTNRTQIVFTNTRCKNCRPQEIDNCIACILEDYNSDNIISPLRIFPTRLKGVHIEIDLLRRVNSDNISFRK